MANNQVANLALHRHWYDLSALLDQQSQAQLSLRRCITQRRRHEKANCIGRGQKSRPWTAATMTGMGTLQVVSKTLGNCFLQAMSDIG